MRRAKSLSLLGAALMIAGPLAFGANAAASYNANGNAFQDVDWSVAWTCGTKGTSLTANGTREVGLGRLKAHFRGANNATAVRDVDATLSVAMAGTYSVTKQPSLDGTGGNPYIWFQADGSNDSILLGRCNEASSKQLIKKFRMRNLMSLSSLASVGANGCSNSTGPDITVGKADKGATRGKVWFTNQNTADPAHTTINDPGKAYGSFGMDMSARVSKGGANGGVTGNPYIKFAFGMDLNGDKQFGALNASDQSTFGVTGEYYLADGTWTDDVNRAYTAERRCTDFGR